MNENQADQMLNLLTKILEKLDDIEAGTSNIPSTAYNASDICQRLDTIERLVDKINDAIDK